MALVQTIQYRKRVKKIIIYTYTPKVSAPKNNRKFHQVVRLPVIALLQEWTDDRLTWNPRVYGGLRQVTLSPDDVWMPEVDVVSRPVMLSFFLPSTVKLQQGEDS